MIQQVTQQSHSQNKTINNEKKKYHDPLNKGVFVVLSNSNEIGTAISDIAPKLGAALWAPTFMYLGADIYDKYKNDKNNYNPSAKRAFKRAIYQALTSLVAMPAAIILGKYIISPLGKLDKTGVSGNTKDAIWYTAKVTLHATSSWKMAVKPIHAQLPDSLRIVARAAAQGI